MAKYTVTEALAKLKVTTKKIEDGITKTLVGYVTTEGANVLPTGIKSRDEFGQEVKKSVASVTDLIAFRDKLKKAVVESNARTTVQVGKKLMTVAEAVEAKGSLKHKKTLLGHLQSNLTVLKQKVAQHNGGLDQQADLHVQKLFGTSAAAGMEEDRKASRANFVKNNTAVLVSSNTLEKDVEKLKDEVDDFEANVDVALSVVNARTEVEVPD